jgi:excinuclease ABC subunit C
VFPDILLIDGGKGQLNAALAAFATSASAAVDHLAGQAGRGDLRARRSRPRVLSRHSFALRLLQYVRDEAHRFAQHYHHMLRLSDELVNIGLREIGRLMHEFVQSGGEIDEVAETRPE